MAYLNHFTVQAGALALLILAAVAMMTTSEGGMATSETGRHTSSLPPPLPPRHRQFADRAERLLRQLSMDEKIGQMSSSAPAVMRDGQVLIPAFEFWQECLHGMKVDVADKGGATIFPQPIALAASFDRQLLHAIGSAIGDELRASSNAAEARGLGPRSTNCFSPNINIYRDPRWGRGSETYGEDPELTAQMAGAYVRGLQGNHSAYLKAGATCKHFALYSLEEHEGISRFEFDAMLDPRDVRDTYLPAFQACASEAASTMCSYNSLNGTPACASRWLLQEQLREHMKFGGFVVSDCGAIDSITDHHEWTPTHAKGFAAALKAGTDMACTDYSHIRQSLDQGLVSEDDINTAVRRLLLARFVLGHFDRHGDDNPFRHIPPSVVGSREHLDLAHRAAAESIVLLKNDPPETADDESGAAAAAPAAPLLPLKLGAMRRLTVLGPMATRSEYVLGNYYGFPAGKVSTPYQAIAERVAAHNGHLSTSSVSAGPAVDLELVTGAEVMGTGADTEAAVAACRRSDACLFFVGTTAVWQAAGEARRFGTLPLLTPVVESEGWDRKNLLLPGRQLNLIQAVAKRSRTPIVVVLVHGGPLDVEWLQRSPRVAAILTAWMPGQGAAAVANVLFGDVAPAGRLPVSFYFNNFTAQSEFTDMSMRRWPGRTHRYLQVPALYPFGHGLSFTSFACSGMVVSSVVAADGARASSSSSSADDGCFTSESCACQEVALLQVTLRVSNTGGMAADEVALLMLSFDANRSQWQRLEEQQGWRRRPLTGLRAPHPAVFLRLPCTTASGSTAGSWDSLIDDLPVHTVAGFERVRGLAPSAAATVSFLLTARHLVPFSPLPSADGEGGGGCPPAAKPYCGDYRLRVGNQELVVRVESSAGSRGGTALP